MHRLNEIVEKLTPSQVKEVEDFAEFLISRKVGSHAAAKEEYLDVAKVAGICEGMGGNKSSVELVHEAAGAWAAKLDRENGQCF